MSVQEEVGLAVGRFCESVSAADPSAVGTTALSAVAALGTAGLAAWWKRRNRNREGRSRVSLDLPAGQRVQLHLDGDGKDV